MNDGLKRRLDCWEVTPVLPGDFQREVWQRIAARQQSAWRQFVRRFFQMLATPLHATLAFLTAIVIGTGVAHLAAGEENARHWNDLQTRYAVSIDPMAQALAE